ncbi:MAG: LEPR-XLL domain-containing protein, partial [Planctomycetes bacterium]|nr:LEPR-XLL domain-containing protein [Planctomycetota bacterium]
MRIFRRTKDRKPSSRRDSKLVTPPVLERLEPRILLSGDGLLNFAPPDPLQDDAQQVVQCAALLAGSEQAQEQLPTAEREIHHGLDASDTPEADILQPIFTLYAGDVNINVKAMAGGLNAGDDSALSGVSTLSENSQDDYAIYVDLGISPAPEQVDQDPEQEIEQKEDTGDLFSSALAGGEYKKTADSHSNVGTAFLFTADGSEVSGPEPDLTESNPLDCTNTCDRQVSTEQLIETLRVPHGPPISEINTLVVEESGTLEGNSAIGQDVIIKGTLSPGNSPGIITIDGDLTFDSDDQDTIDDSYIPPAGPDAEDTVSTLVIEIGGSTPGAGGSGDEDNGYDQVNVTGDVTLAGELEIVLINDYEPVLGTTFDFLTFDTVSGTFDTVSGPWGFGGSDVYFEINRLSDRLQLEVAEIPTGVEFHSATSVTDNAEAALAAMAEEVDQALSDLLLADGYLTGQLIPGTGMSLDVLFDISGYFGIGSAIEDYLEPMQPLGSELRFEIDEFLSYIRGSWLGILAGGSAGGGDWGSPRYPGSC